jgi:hypothetical protein
MILIIGINITIISKNLGSKLDQTVLYTYLVVIYPPIIDRIYIVIIVVIIVIVDLNDFL